MMPPNGITFQDVVGRESREIIFTPNEIESLQNQRILITGAGGSIGSQITKLISSLETVEFLATDRDETALHSLSLDLKSAALFQDTNFQLLDIRDHLGISNCFKEFQPTTVIHTAALKHLSVLERQPREALLTNVYGTFNLIKCIMEYKVGNFCNISTDKAAQPQSVLGVSKRFSEILTTYVRRSTEINATNCRFGNVFNSRGSVIETFTSQMVRGLPITLTDLEVTRYFMSVNEAAFLTLKSLLINLHDIYIFEMGSPIKLIDVIVRMQELLKTSSPILETGLRNGEKLHEDLVFSDEKLEVTHDSSIYGTSLNLCDSYVEEIYQLVSKCDANEILRYLTRDKILN